MGMTACVTCMGAYSEKLAEWGVLSGDENEYDPEEKTCMILVDVLYCGTSSKSRLLAKMLGIDLKNRCKHEVDDKKVDWRALNEEFGAAEALRFGRLMEAGFLCVFNPDA